MAGPLAVSRPGDSLSSWATISISCLSNLALLAAGALWLVPHGPWIVAPFPRRAASLVSADAPAPATFPSWIEVPHLAGPSAHADDPDAFPPAGGPRSFLDPDPADASGPPIALPPRANPRLPLIGPARRDAARLAQEPRSVWDAPAARPDPAPATPPSVVATLGPEEPPPFPVVQARLPAAPTRPAEPVSVPVQPPIPSQVLPPRPAPISAPAETAVRPAQPVAALPPPGRVATRGPDPAQPVVERAAPATSPPDAGPETAPVLGPGPARPARALRQRAAAARVPDPAIRRSVGVPRSPGVRIDAGAVAYASVHRARADRAAGSAPAPAPSAPWTLPSALAPTD